MRNITCVPPLREKPLADPQSYRPAVGQIPTTPGVYRFLDQHRRVIYVGKAKNLRSRLNSYFSSVSSLHPKTYAMVHAAASVEWTVVGSELEAIQLEYTWIKQHTPRFNIRYRDDKSYPYLAITMNERVPRVQVMRGDKKPGVKYFGPFHPAKAIRETMDTMLRVYPIRSCAAGQYRRAEAAQRPCLLGYIDKCAAPCVGKISLEDHRALAQQFVEVMNGNAEAQIADITEKMRQAVQELRYEDAARHRDDLEALRRVFERNAVVLSEDTNADIFAFAQDELEVSAQVFHVRQGRIRGQRGWTSERVEDIDDAGLTEQLLLQVYGDLSDPERIPQEILVPVIPDNAEEISRWLSQQRSDHGLRRTRVTIKVPHRGDKAALLGTVAENADHGLALHKARRSSDITTRSAALRELQDALGLDEPLMRIECFDISHISGSHVVGSMVVFEDGLPKKRDYRRFTISGEAARDDTSSMYDVVYRRFSRYLKEGVNAAPEPASGAEGAVAAEATTAEGAPGAVAATKGIAGAEPATQATADPAATLESTVEPAAPSAFAYPPSLVVVDGAAPQVNAAQQALTALGLTDLPVVGLAKRLEEVWVPEDEFPVILPRSSESLFLLQRIRDEAHRFAITHHRSRRSRDMTASALDEVPGLGAKRRSAVVAHFGSVSQLRQASAQSIAEVPGIGLDTAQRILDYLNPSDTAAETAPEEES